MRGTIWSLVGWGTSPDPDFQAWLARLQGSRGQVFEDRDAEQWLELENDIMTY